jgi:hypothetical protein
LTAHLDLADHLLIAEAVLGVPAEEIARWPGMGLAESALHAPAAGFAGVEFYQDVIDKAAATDPAVAQPGYREWLRRGSPGAENVHGAQHAAGSRATIEWWRSRRLHR